MPTEFRNEPLTDFSKEENAQAMRAAIDKVKTQLGQEYPLVIGGERINTGDILASVNPAQRNQVVGKFHKATKELANRAVEAAYETFQSWRNVPAEEPLPKAINSVPNLTRRELVIIQDKDTARVSSSGKLTGPIVYEFRLAHS